MVVGVGTWKPIKLSRDGLPHLSFADGLKLFVETSLDQASVIKDVLNLFCESSGQKVSAEKSRVFFSGNVHNTRRQQISEAMGFSRTMDLEKYLSIPLLNGRARKQDFQYLLDKAVLRLFSWKTRTLSLAGCATFVSSVLSALPNYVMQTTWLPL